LKLLDDSKCCHFLYIIHLATGFGKWLIDFSSFKSVLHYFYNSIQNAPSTGTPASPAHRQYSFPSQEQGSSNSSAKTTSHFASPFTSHYIPYICKWTPTSSGRHSPHEHERRRGKVGIGTIWSRLDSTSKSWQAGSSYRKRFRDSSDYSGSISTYQK